LLRSKSLDRNSYNSGDWFNRLDFTYQMNNWGIGLPPAADNQGVWPIMQPLLADPALAPTPADIAFARDTFRELLEIRRSSPLFRLQTAVDIQDRLAFHNTGPEQIPGLIVMSLSDTVGENLDPNYGLLVVLFNAQPEAVTFTEAALTDLPLELHPVLANSVDPIVQTATFNPSTGEFSVPARTTAVFVLSEEAAEALRETAVPEPAPEPTEEPAAPAETPTETPAEPEEPAEPAEPAPAPAEESGSSWGLWLGILAGGAAAAGGAAYLLRRRKA
jgi:pullulanase